MEEVMIHVTRFTYDRNERLIEVGRWMNAEEVVELLANALYTFDEINFSEVTYDRIHLIIGNGKNSVGIVIENGDYREMMPVIGFIYWWASGWGQNTQITARKVADNLELDFRERSTMLDEPVMTILCREPAKMAIMMAYGIFDYEELRHGLALSIDNMSTMCALAKEAGVSLREIIEQLK